MRVFNEEMYFHFIGEVFLYIFANSSSRLNLNLDPGNDIAESL
jgi:hypothetical protein